MNTRTRISINPWKWLFKLGYVILAALWILLTLDILWPLFSDRRNSPESLRPHELAGTNYLIIAPQALGKGASAWADYRRGTGYQTQVILLTPSQAKPDEIRDLIQETYEKSRKPFPFYVLLIGQAHSFSSHPNSYLPTTHFSVDPNQSSGYGTDPIASDDGFISVDPNGTPGHILPIFIGRIPVRTEKEAFLLLQRTRSYEETPPTGEGRARIELISSDAGFGPQYDPLFEWALRTLVQKVLPDEYRWHMLYGNPHSRYSYPVDSFPNEVAARFDSGSLAVVYIGHAQPELMGWAYSLEGERNRVFSFEDAGLIRNANASLAFFTACSAGKYDLAGDNLSVVESIYLTPGGPVATYSSSAWINAAMNGRLVIDIFEALLIDNTSTLGEWMYRVEYRSGPIASRLAPIALLKGIIPRMSGMYENKPLLSPTQAGQVLAIQYATYNLFGDPALRIAYPQTGLEINPTWLWQPGKDHVAFYGKGDLPAGQQVMISLEALPGTVISQEDNSIGSIGEYFQANNPVISRETVYTASGGNFSGKMVIPTSARSGKYLLRAVSLLGQDTLITAHPVYIGWPPIIEILSSPVFWWSLISGLLITKSRIIVKRNCKSR